MIIKEERNEEIAPFPDLSLHFLQLHGSYGNVAVEDGKRRVLETCSSSPTST
jgi:hypothetical protein